MSSCNSIQPKFSDYLDGRLTGHEMQDIAAHLDACEDCAREWKALKQTQMSLAALGPVQQPEDLLLRIRVAISQERARSRRPAAVLEAGLGKHSGAVPAAGLRLVLRARFCCWAQLRCWWGCLPGPRLRGVKMNPSGMATSPHFLYLSSAITSNDQIREGGGPVVVEAYINGQGEVYDYRIVSGPIDDNNPGASCKPAAVESL